MKTIAAVAAVLLLSLAVNLAGVHAGVAQDFTLPPPNILPPPPPPLPPPNLEVPKIPKMGEIPSPPRAALPSRGSFSDRVSRCIDESAGMGLGPNERAAYTGACANR